jgi:predicted DNA-binding transcriptional regulator AlpA
MSETVLCPGPGQSPTATTRQFLDAKQVGARLGCSWRHVLRMADRGLMPWGVKLGALRRWDSVQIELWIQDGCPTVRRAKS